MSVPQEQMMGAPEPAAMDQEMQPPPMGGGATPDDAMMAMEQEQRQAIENIKMMAPEPEGPYSVSLLQKLVDAMNNLLDTVDPEMAKIEFAAEGPRINEKLPEEIFVPFVLIMSFLATMPGMDKFMMMPEEMVNDAAIRKAIAKIQMMQKDKELIDKLKAPPEQMQEEEEMAETQPSPEAEVAGAMPEDMEADDEELMARM